MPRPYWAKSGCPSSLSTNLIHSHASFLWGEVGERVIASVVVRVARRTGPRGMGATSQSMFFASRQCESHQEPVKNMETLPVRNIESQVMLGRSLTSGQT
jgi:hypothetical protein